MRPPPRQLRRRCLVAASSAFVLGAAPSAGAPVPGRPTPIDRAAPATIEGRVEISRTLAARRPRFRIYAEPGVGATPPAPDVRDQDERRNIVLYIEHAPSAPPAYAATSSQHAVLRQHGERFMPHVLPVVRGTTVDFVNDDDLFHNVFSLSRAKEFDLGRYPRGAFRSETFDRSGVVQLFCHIHSDMSATLLVLENPYFAVPDENGHYAIPSLPPGDYTVVAWHERIRPITHRLHLEPGQAAELDFTIPLPVADAAHER